MQMVEAICVLREIMAPRTPVDLTEPMECYPVTPLACCSPSGPGEQQTTKTGHIKNMSLFPVVPQTL